MAALEAAEDGPGLGQASGGSATDGQLAGECPRREALLGDGTGRVPFEDVGHGAGGAAGQLTLEGLGAVEGFGREGTRSAAVGAWPGLEGVKAAGEVVLLPAAQGGDADGAALGVGDEVLLGGDGLADLALGAVALSVVAQQGQNEGVAEQSHLGSPRLIGGGRSFHRFGSV